MDLPTPTAAGNASLSAEKNAIKKLQISISQVENGYTVSFYTPTNLGPSTYVAKTYQDIVNLLERIIPK